MPLARPFLLGLLLWVAVSPVFAAPPPAVRLIAASSTDPAIADINGVHHVAIGQPEDRIGRLFLYLPGTTASPQAYTQLIERSAALGYHAIGLSYVNELAVNAVCSGMGASGCHEFVRREVILGVDLSPLVDVDLDNSIFNRLDRLLAHLEGIFPNEGWDTYRDPSGQIRWDRVVVSGHSQGAGHAAFIGKLERVARVVLFAGTEPAPWTSSGTFATPAADYYGFVHAMEPFFTGFQMSWDNLGIPGAPTFVDGVLPPFAFSQQLQTSNLDCVGNFHGCPCVDGRMPPPLPDLTPFFQYVWDHLLALPVLCGDVDLDTDIDAADIALLRTHLADPLGVPFSPEVDERCPVILPPASGCDVLDLVVMRRQFEGGGLGPGIAPVCPAAQPNL